MTFAIGIGSAGSPPQDKTPRAAASGLRTFDLPTVFKVAVELAEAASNVVKSEWDTFAQETENPTSPDSERRTELNRRLQRIAQEAERLKRVLGATGQLSNSAVDTVDGGAWQDFFEEFKNTVHDRVVRLAFLKMATAAIDLSGFSEWRTLYWHMHESGQRLLAWGLAQLWEGMNEPERSSVRDRLRRTMTVIGWPADTTADPPVFGGPAEIPIELQYRTIDMSRFVSCPPDHLMRVQEDMVAQVDQGHAKFLRRASLSRFVEMAEEAEKAVRSLARRDYDTSAQWGDLYQSAFWSLELLRKAAEIEPFESWPAAALEHRKAIARAAGILLTCVGGTAEAKASLKPEDANEASEELTSAIGQLRKIQAPEKVMTSAEANPATCNQDAKKGATTSKKRGRPKLADSRDPKDQRKFNLYRVITAARKNGESPAALAERLSIDRDKQQLAKDAGFSDGITVQVVENAIEHKRYSERQNNSGPEKALP